MAKNIPLIVFPVTDLAKAKAFYSEFLDTEPYADSPYYVGYKAENIEVGLDPNSTAGPIAYTEVEDINASMAALIEAGGASVKEPQDVGGGMLVAQAKDIDGNIIGFRQQP